MNFIVNKYQGNVKLLLIACDEDEQKFLESHIGEVVELHAPQHRVHWTLPIRAIAENHSLKAALVNFVVLASGSASNANR